MRQEEYEYDPTDYVLPPVVLPQAAVPIAKQKLLVTVPDNFKERVVQIDESAIESLEYLSEGTLLAIGCQSGWTKIFAPTQGTVPSLYRLSPISAERRRSLPCLRTRP
jgi:hypothetical protein